MRVCCLAYVRRQFSLTNFCRWGSFCFSFRKWWQQQTFVTHTRALPLSSRVNINFKWKTGQTVTNRQVLFRLNNRRQISILFSIEIYAMTVCSVQSFSLECCVCLCVQLMRHPKAYDSHSSHIYTTKNRAYSSECFGHSFFNLIRVEWVDETYKKQNFSRPMYTHIHFVPHCTAHSITRTHTLHIICLNWFGRNGLLLAKIQLTKYNELPFGLDGEWVCV